MGFFLFVFCFVLLFFVCFLLIHTDSWGVDFFRRGVCGDGVPRPPLPLESTAYSAGLLFAHEVRHEIKLVLPQPEFGQLLDAVQTHFYH